MIFQGIYTAIITPFKNNQIDYDSFENLLEKQIEAAVDGIVVGGSTGEGSSLKEDEYNKLISFAAQRARNKIKVIAGMTGISTQSSCEKVSRISELGVDGIMCTTPQYIRPEQDGLYQHFEQISKSTQLPLMLYLHPGRTGVGMSDDTLIKLSKLTNITALKDADNDIERPLRLHSKTADNFSYLIGDDSKMLAYSANGGRGVVSVAANIYPKTSKKIIDYCLQDDIASARLLATKLITAINTIGTESNPIGIKCAANIIGLCSNEIRLPLTIAKPSTYASIKKVIEDLGDIENYV